MWGNNIAKRREDFRIKRRQKGGSGAEYPILRICVYFGTFSYNLLNFSNDFVSFFPLNSIAGGEKSRGET